MLLQAARNLGDSFLETGRHAVSLLRRVPLAAALLFTVALGWVLITGWWNYIRPEQFDQKAYERFQEQVAQCRELKTSEARYDCVAEAMIGRDQSNFGKSMFVFLPPLGLLFGYYIIREMCAARREREHAAMAERRSREQLSKMRAEIRAERAAAEAAKAENENAEPNRVHHGPHAVLLSHVQPVSPNSNRA